MLNLSTLFFISLASMVVATGFMQPHLDKYVRATGYPAAFQFLYFFSVVHWILGALLVTGFWTLDVPSFWVIPNLWETIGAVAFQTFLGHRYAQLATWVKRKGILKEQLGRSVRTFSKR